MRGAGLVNTGAMGKRPARAMDHRFPIRQRIQPSRAGRAALPLPSSSPPPSRNTTSSTDADNEVDEPDDGEEGRMTASEVRWADVQIHEAARRVKAAEEVLACRKRELVERTRLHAQMTDAHELRVSAAQLVRLLESREAEVKQRQNDAALAREQAKLAVKRKQEARDALQSIRQRERAAKEAVAELQQSLSASSREGSSVASED